MTIEWRDEHLDAVLKALQSPHEAPSTNAPLSTAFSEERLRSWVAEAARLIDLRQPSSQISESECASVRELAWRSAQSKPSIVSQPLPQISLAASTSQIPLSSPIQVPCTASIAGNTCNKVNATVFGAIGTNAAEWWLEVIIEASPRSLIDVAIVTVIFEGKHVSELNRDERFIMLLTPYGNESLVGAINLGPLYPGAKFAITCSLSNADSLDSEEVPILEKSLAAHSGDARPSFFVVEKVWRSWKTILERLKMKAATSIQSEQLEALIIMCKEQLR